MDALIIGWEHSDTLASVPRQDVNVSFWSRSGLLCVMILESNPHQLCSDPAGKQPGVPWRSHD